MSSKLSFLSTLLMIVVIVICQLFNIGMVSAQTYEQPEHLQKRFKQNDVLSLAKTFQVDVPYIAKQPVIDGVYDKNEWQGATQTNLPFITRPFEELPAPVDTRVKIFENGSDVFILFIALDPDPEAIRAFLRDRDSSRGEDLVGVKFDTFNDGRLAYNFFINPLGVQSDSIENEMTGSESSSWNGIWDSAGQITSDGYIVEVRIPLRLMNFEQTEKGKKWGIEFVRFYPREDSYRLSSVPFNRDNSCNLCQIGIANGFAKAKQQNNLAVVPTLVVGKSRSRDPIATQKWDQLTDQEVGLDINWGVTPEITITGTLNPDFSQVEADSGQLNINRTFALFFNERRPFFVENADYFSSTQNFIYTRNINAPDYGAKVTGRVDNHSLGMFVTNDNTTNFLIPGNLGSSIAFLSEQSTNFATRYRYDYSDELSIGLVGTLRQSDSYKNALQSADIRYRVTDVDTFRAQISYSQTQYPEFLNKDFCDNNCEQPDELSESALRTRFEDTFVGRAVQLIYNRDTDNYYINARHNDTDSNFRADLGFISNVDTKKSVLGGGYFWRTDDDWWNQVRLRGDWDITHNDDNELIEREVEGYLSLSAVYQSFAEIGFRERTRVGLRHDPSSLAITDNTTRFSEMSHSFYAEATPNQTFSFGTFIRKGDTVDLPNNRLGKQTYIEHFIEANVGKHLRLEFETQRSRLEVNDLPLFDAHLYDFRTTYQFDVRQFLRLVVNYSDIDRNQSNYTFSVDENSKNLGVQVLYSYKVNPLTKYFIGFSQGAFDNDDLNSLKADSQNLFVKFSYAWLPQI